MRYSVKLVMITISMGLVMTMPARAFDGRHAYEVADGHWIYFGPDSSSYLTTPRVLPLKRSLEQSIRQDALRHYAMPEYELAESGVVISFYSERNTVRDKASIPPSTRTPKESLWEVFELPESGETIRFAKDVAKPDPEGTFVARQDDGPSG